MHEWSHAEKGHGEQASLDNRLAAYYGPELREQPLPESAWLGLRAYLGPQKLSKRQRVRQWYNRYRPRRVQILRRVHRRSTPAYIQDSFVRLVYETRQQHPLPILQCSLNSRTRVPVVRVSPLGRYTIKLVLPPDTAQALGPSELEVVLATGLARLHYIRKPASILLRLLFISTVLLSCIALILFGTHKSSIAGFLIAATLCGVVAWLLYQWTRRYTFQADALVVQWLGRSRTCQGLHALANRSRSRYRGRWGEPSLAERIKRVCGMQVPIENDRLTLVR